MIGFRLPSYWWKLRREMLFACVDFQDCLNDLTINNRYEISNLTIIAKENIEHAQEISRTLEKHIRTVRYDTWTMVIISFAVMMGDMLILSM